MLSLFKQLPDPDTRPQSIAEQMNELLPKSLKWEIRRRKMYSLEFD